MLHVRTGGAVPSQSLTLVLLFFRHKSVTTSGTLSNLKRSFASAFAKETNNPSTSQTAAEVQKQPRLDTFVSRTFTDSTPQGESETETSLRGTISHNMSQEKSKWPDLTRQGESNCDSSSDVVAQTLDGDKSDVEEETRDPGEDPAASAQDSFSEDTSAEPEAARDSAARDDDDTLSNSDGNVQSIGTEQRTEGNRNLVTSDHDEDFEDRQWTIKMDDRAVKDGREPNNNSHRPAGEEDCETTTENKLKHPFQKDSCGDTVTVTEFDVAPDKCDVTKRKCVEVKFSMRGLKRNLKEKERTAKIERERKEERRNVFHAKIAPGDNQAAETELSECACASNYALSFEASMRNVTSTFRIRRMVVCANLRCSGGGNCDTFCLRFWPEFYS